MLWNFQNFTLEFVNGEWWQQNETNLQNKHFLSWFGTSKKKKFEFCKLIRSIKNQNWTLIQKSNEKENEKTGASC